APGRERAISPSEGFLGKPAVAAATLQKHQVQTYSVQQGDTLSGVADQFGLSIDTLRWANGLTDLDTLALDQKLLVPPVDGVLLTVKQGETLDSLAAKYQVASGAIIEFNLIRDPDHLGPGTQLMIPDGIGAPLPVT